MERTARRITLPALAALALLAACAGGGTGEAPPADDGAWMDTALVMVVTDPATHHEKVTLVDRASGRSQQMSDEEVTDDVVEVEDPQ